MGLYGENAVDQILPLEQSFKLKKPHIIPSMTMEAWGDGTFHAITLLPLAAGQDEPGCCVAGGRSRAPLVEEGGEQREPEVARHRAQAPLRR